MSDSPGSPMVIFAGQKYLMTINNNNDTQGGII